MTNTSSIRFKALMIDDSLSNIDLIKISISPLIEDFNYVTTFEQGFKIIITLFEILLFICSFLLVLLLLFFMINLKFIIIISMIMM